MDYLATMSDILVDLTLAFTDFEAQVIRQRLESDGIPAFAATTAGSMLARHIYVSNP